VVLTVEVKDDGGVYVDPTSSPTVKVTDPAGAMVVNDLAMTKDAVGKYHYDYMSGDTAVVGVYRWRCKAVDGARTTKKIDSFALEAD